MQEVNGGLTAAQPVPRLSGDFLYEFHRSPNHPRGILRTSTPAALLEGRPDWQVVLDLDALAESEDEPWVWMGVRFLQPGHRRAMVLLSRRGGDAVVAREFDMATRRFVEDGFFLPEAKQLLLWWDEDHLLMCSGADPRGATVSGYGRVVRRLARGQTCAEAEILFEGEPGDFSIGLQSIMRPEGQHLLIRRRPDFFSSRHLLLDGERWVPLDLPDRCEVRFLGEDLVVWVRSDWEIGGDRYDAGSVVAIDRRRFLGGARDFSVLHHPEPGTRIEGIRVTKTFVVLELLRNVSSELWLIQAQGKGWRRERLAQPAGALKIITNDEYTDLFLFSHESYLRSWSLNAHRDDRTVVHLGSDPELYQADGLVERLFWATSKDGTRVPYHLVGPKGVLDGSRSAPTMLTAYGGFGKTLLPRYDPFVGVCLLERGGVYVHAGIRGGGELGPAWHEGGRRRNRQHSYDDFIAVAEDLIRRGITAPDRLGIFGDSNAGLLVGVAITQRPELFAAAAAGVPLMDMLRYTELLAGHSWISEYGNPKDPEDREVLRSYSPYHNIRADAVYPPLLVTTRSYDDRVHPGHGRRMVARMQAMGHDVLFFEQDSGGHAAYESIDLPIRDMARRYAFLLDHMGHGPRR